MQFFKRFFHNFGSNILTIFSGYNLLWHLLAFALTYLIVISGFDWTYFRWFGHGWISIAMFPAAIVGFFVPIYLPINLWILGRKNPKLLYTGYAAGQAAFLGWLISSFFKAFTGRNYPPWQKLSALDTSRVFHFGFWRSGIFWGWPSSHTTVAFAVALTLIVLYPKNKTVRFWAALFAIYTGLGVSFSIHWFSDFVAGAIIGTVIGVVVGRSFLKLQNFN